MTTPQIFTQTMSPITATAHDARRNTKIESRSDLVFVEIVIESETCYIYKVILLTIKVAAHNTSEISNS
jgi:hypothetical protein